MFYDTTKADWKLFQEKLPIWQEKFMKKLNNEYIQLLTEPKHDSEKFWELEKRIKTDRRKKGVICELRKSIMVDNIISLINEDAITTTVAPTNRMISTTEKGKDIVINNIGIIFFLIFTFFIYFINYFTIESVFF